MQKDKMACPTSCMAQQLQSYEQIPISGIMCPGYARKYKRIKTQVDQSPFLYFYVFGNAPWECLGAHLEKSVYIMHKMGKSLILWLKTCID